MRIIFCTDPLYGGQPDSNYVDEASAAQAASFDVELIALERLVDDNDAHAAVYRITPAPALELGVYRGWMLRSEQYAALYEALLQRGVQLINSPEAYCICHELPAGYDFIRSYTSQTVWLPVPDCFDLDQVMAALTVFGEEPVILKDYVKSRKHEWLEARFIPSAADRNAVQRVVDVL